MNRSHHLLRLHHRLGPCLGVGFLLKFVDSFRNPKGEQILRPLIRLHHCHCLVGHLLPPHLKVSQVH